MLTPYPQIIFSSPSSLSSKISITISHSLLSWLVVPQNPHCSLHLSSHHLHFSTPLISLSHTHTYLPTSIAPCEFQIAALSSSSTLPTISHLEKEIGKKKLRTQILGFVCGFGIWFNLLYDAFLEGLQFVLYMSFFSFGVLRDFLFVFVYMSFVCFFLFFCSVHSVENGENNLRLFSKNTKLRTWRTNLKTLGTIVKHVFECFPFSSTKNRFWKQQPNMP